MKINALAVTVTAFAVMSAACAKHSSPAAAPVDPAVAAEASLNKAGCSFKEGTAPVSQNEWPTSGTNAKTLELNCATSKDQKSQVRAVADYTTKITAAMKDNKRKDLDKLQAKLDIATAKLVDLDGGTDSPSESARTPVTATK